MALEPVLASSEVLLRTTVFDVERLECTANGESFTREVVRHPGAVAVIAADGDEVVLVRQWRAPLGAALLEVVAGTCDVAGEEPAATAARELEEEAGLRAASIEPLCEVLNAPGWSDQRTTVFVASGLTDVPARPGGPEEAAIEVVRMGLDDAVAMVLGPGACDATTAVAVLALSARRTR